MHLLFLACHTSHTTPNVPRLSHYSKCSMPLTLLLTCHASHTTPNVPCLSHYSKCATPLTLLLTCHPTQGFNTFLQAQRFRPVSPDPFIGEIYIVKRAKRAESGDKTNILSSTKRLTCNDFLLTCHASHTPLLPNMPHLSHTTYS